jgi:hypothetical protein
MAKRSGPGKPPSGDEPYEVGYKKPPAHTRFQPGASGNPKGRQKGVNNLATDIKNALASKITVRSGGKGRVVSTQEAGIMVLKEKALKGDSRALETLLSLAGKYNNDSAQDAGNELLPDDEEVLRAYEEEVRASATPRSKKEG